MAKRYVTRAQSQAASLLLITIVGGTIERGLTASPNEAEVSFCTQSEVAATSDVLVAGATGRSCWARPQLCWQAGTGRELANRGHHGGPGASPSSRRRNPDTPQYPAPPWRVDRRSITGQEPDLGFSLISRAAASLRSTVPFAGCRMRSSTLAPKALAIFASDRIVGLRRPASRPLRYERVNPERNDSSSWDRACSRRILCTLRPTTTRRSMRDGRRDAHYRTTHYSAHSSLTVGTIAAFYVADRNSTPK